MKVRVVVHKPVGDSVGNEHIVVHDGTKLLRTAADVAAASTVVVSSGNRVDGTFVGGQEALDEENVECEVEVDGDSFAALFTDTETWASFEVASVHGLSCWRAETWKGKASHMQFKLTLPKK
jgi:hypothetical protein